MLCNYADRRPGVRGQQYLRHRVGYSFPDYADDEDEEDPETQALMSVMESPEVLDLLVRQASGEELDKSELMAAMIKAPNVAGLMAKAMA